MEIFVKVLWAIVSCFIIVLGIYFSIHFDFLQFRIKEYQKSFRQQKKDKVGISPLASFLLTLAGRIGVGSIAGVALAIYIGGAGTVFWIWVISLLTLPISYLETVLGSLYKQKSGQGYVGGPSYYIFYGLNKPLLAKLYAIFLLGNFLCGFLGIQVNTIVKITTPLFPVSPVLIGCLLAIFTVIVIIGDIRSISGFTSKLVPFMVLFYFLLCCFVFTKNLDMIIPMICYIIKSAFSLRPFFSGFLYTAIIGIQRGIFSAETGVGTGSIAASTSSSQSPKKDGYLQMLGVIATAVICTMTSFLVLLSPYSSIHIADPNGIEIAAFAFGYHFHSLGIFLLVLFIFLCSFSTILTGYYDAFVSIQFLFHCMKPIYKWILIIVTFLMIVVSSILSSSFLWILVDLFVALLILINLYSIFYLQGEVDD